MYTRRTAIFLLQVTKHTEIKPRNKRYTDRANNFLVFAKIHKNPKHDISFN